MLGRRMLRPKRDLCSLITQQRFASSPAADAGCRVRPRRGLLYVPGSDEKKLRKSFGLDVDALCFDLEDSVTADRKAGARETVLYALGAAGGNAEKLVRINSNGSGMANDDLEIVLGSPKLQGIVIPKVHSAEDVIKVHEMVEKHAHREAKDSIKLIASIESAKAIMNLKEIANASPRVESLLFAAEDFCADTGITRSKDRRELLYARSAVVLAAKAYGLGAIDLVCIHYQDKETLQDECDEGRKLGFTAKQIIHPGQIETIQKTYSPSTEDIEKAKRILENYEAAVKTGKGAYGLGGEMIDAPMILQAESVLAKARSYGLS